MVRHGSTGPCSGEVKEVTPSHPQELSCSPTTAAAGLALPPACGDEKDLAGLTIMDAAKLLRSKSASPVDPTRVCLKRMKTTITSYMRSSQFFERESLPAADLWADSL